MERIQANDSHRDPELLDTVNTAEVRRQIPLIVFLVVVCLTGILGNWVVCYIYKARRILSSSRWFIFFLAAVDIGACLLAIPFEIVTDFMQYNITNKGVCKASAFVNLWSLLCPGLLLVLIAVDRYRKVCAPLKWQLNLFRAKLSCLVVVGVSLALSIPAPWIYDIHPFILYNHNITAYRCSFQHKDSEPWTFYYLVFGLVLFVAALTTICVLYCFIGGQIRQHVLKAQVRRNLSGDSTDLTKDIITTDGQSCDVDDDHGNSEWDTTDLDKPPETKFRSRKQKRHSKRIRQARSRKATFIMFLISLVFVLSYLPMLSLLLVRSMHPGIEDTMSDSARTAYKFFLRSFFINFAANPLIYGVSDSRFRSDCKAALRMCYKRIYRVN